MIANHTRRRCIRYFGKVASKAITTHNYHPHEGL